MINKKNEKRAQDLLIALTKSWIIKNIDIIPENRFAKEYIIIKSNFDTTVQSEYFIHANPENWKITHYSFENIYTVPNDPITIWCSNLVNDTLWTIESLERNATMRRLSYATLTKNKIYVLPKFNKSNFAPDTINILYSIKFNDDIAKFLPATVDIPQPNNTIAYDRYNNKILVAPSGAFSQISIRDDDYGVKLSS